MSGELILIVEDQPLNRKLVRDVLQAKLDAWHREHPEQTFSANK